MKEKGMTLVELLAVIVVLAIVSLIAVPTVLNIISRVRLNALKDSAYGLVEAGTMYNAQYQNTKNIRFDLDENGATSEDTENKLSYKGKVKIGTVIIDRRGKTTVCISDGTNSAYKNYDETKVTLVKSQTCTIPENTYIVYLDGEATKDELSNPQLTDLLYALQERMDRLEQEKANQSDLDVVAGVANNAQETAENAASKEELDGIGTIAKDNQEAIKGLASTTSLEALAKIANEAKTLAESAATSAQVETLADIANAAKTAADNAATKTQLDGLASKVKNLEDNSTTKGYVDDNITALRSEIPSIDGLATTSQLNSVSSIANSKASLKDVYPVGSIYITATEDTAAKVKAKFGGEWEAYGQGRALVGVGTSDQAFAGGTTGGKSTTSYTPAGTISGTTGSVALSLTQIPSHSHDLNSHTHSIPALSGTAASSGAHTHTFTGSSTTTSSKSLKGSFQLKAHGVVGRDSTAGTDMFASFSGIATSGTKTAGTFGVITTSSTKALSNHGVSIDATHTHTVTAVGKINETGAHKHSVTTDASITGAASGNTASAGGNTSGTTDGHSHSFSATLTGTSANISTLQPYITVYMWKRTA